MGYHYGAHTVFEIHLHVVWTKNSYKLLSEFPHLKKVFWGRHLWARWYFCCSSGRITDEMIKAYIEEQSHEDDIDFKVEGEE